MQKCYLYYFNVSWSFFLKCAIYLDIRVIQFSKSSQIEPPFLYSMCIGDTRSHTNQEWSSMESSSSENWDEIEMLFGHLVSGNL